MRTAALALAATLTFAAASPGAAAPAYTVERVVMLMRHGVRPPTKAPPMAPGIAADPWPAWSTTPGWLTDHGAQAIRLLGVADRQQLVADGLLPAAGCPVEGAVALSSDSDERTIATGDAWAAGLAPDCALANHHHAQGDPDPLFHGNERAGLDPARANAAVAATLGPGGIAAAEQRERPALAALDHILCGARASGCGVSSHPSSIAPASPGKSARLAGALDLGSTFAQTLLLEYAEGKPMAEVGWGRASAANIALAGSLHATEFALLARPPALALANSGEIAAIIRDTLDKGTARVTMIVGHDTNVANMAGLLGSHWTIPGFATDDPTPGGALMFELLRDAKGGRYVRAFYRSQTLDQIRTLSPGPVARGAIAIRGCPALPGSPCPWDRFVTALQGN